MPNAETFEESGFIVYEVESENESQLDMEVPAHDDIDSVFILIESEGEIYDLGGNLDIGRLPEENIFNSTVENKQQRVMMRTIPDDVPVVEPILVTAYVEENKRSRIMVVLFKRGFRMLQKHLSCRACKKLVKTLISMILSSFGLTVWPIDFDWRILPDRVNDSFDKFNAVVQNLCRGITDDFVDLPVIQHTLSMLDNPLIHHILHGIQDLLGVLEDILGIVDDVLTAICRRLEFCD